METINGVPEAGLAGVLSDIVRAKMIVFSITKMGETYTVVYGPPVSGNIGGQANTGSPDATLPSKPPVTNMDQPAPPPAGDPGEFVHARVIAPKTILYTDAAGREQVREGGSRSWRNCNAGNIRKGDFSINCGAIGDDGSLPSSQAKHPAWQPSSRC